MSKTAKELAFLRDLYVDPDWTRRFAELLDKHLKFDDDKSVLYLNAGAGNHALEIANRAGRKARISAVCEDEHLLAIAREKAVATRSTVEFSDASFDDEDFDSVVANASLIRPDRFSEVVAEAARCVEPGGTVAVFGVGAGSFGEVFSILWEVLLDAPGSESSLAERLITELPTVSVIEETLAAAGFDDVETKVAKETFEFENGQAFIDSPLVADFLMSGWFAELGEQEIERVRGRLAQLIDEEDADLSFRFSLKAILALGTKY